MRKLICCALLLLCFVAEGQSKIGETIEVSIVNVDVVVTDKAGKRVTGLTADDFEIREGGKVQPISNFAEYRSDLSGGVTAIETVPGAATPAVTTVARPKRNVIVFVESVRLLPHQAREMYGSIRTLLRETIAKGDRATVITWTNAVLVRQPFTDDLASLERVVNELEIEAVNGPRDVSRDIRRDQGRSDAAEDEMAASLAAGGVASASGGMPPVHALEAAKRQLAQIKQKTHVLEALMHSISGLDGRKVIVMAMRRFGVFAGAEYFNGEMPVERRREFETAPLHDRLVKTANAHGITLYPVFPVGLRWDPEDSSYGPDLGSLNSDNDLLQGALQGKIMFNETNALADLAEKTGGLMAWGSKNIADMLPRVVDDLEAYYSLAYRARTSGKDVSRDIAVRAKNSDYRVRSRKQFVEKSDATLMNDRVIANLYQTLDGTSFAFDVVGGEMKSTGRNRWALPLKVRIPIAALTTLPSGAVEVGEFSVYVVTGAVVGVSSEVQHKTQSFRIPRNDLAKAKASYYTYEVTLNIDQKTDRLSVGVIDETSKEFALKRLTLPPRPEK
ncbi:MAG TPA: VWA domain-containing protein [Thermoanaerobaculia bacterium]